MADYKLSKYNFVFPYPYKGKGPRQTVMYNTRTGALALIEEDKYAKYKAFEDEGVLIDDEELLGDLRMGGYVIDCDFDELASLRLNMLRSRFSTSAFGLTIAPTSDCNFRCVYCYEKDSIKPVTMSPETQADLIEFVKARMPFISAFGVSWYGGEPLLAIDIVERLSHEFMAMCEEHHVEYTASIVTNGYLLTPKMMDRLNAIKVSNWQVTLDGAAEDHDKRRCLKGGLPTFDRILDNLVSIKDKVEGKIAIRINADRHNIDRVDNVIKALREKDLMDVCAPYLAMVENLNGTYNDNSCLHTNEFSQCDFDFIGRNGLDYLQRIPAQITNYCGADNNNSFVIASDGLIYKCWNSIGIESQSIGSLKDGINETPLYHSLLLYDATEDEECKDCKFLPVCMGGCPYLREHNPSIRCTSMKHGLAAFMDVIPSILEKQIDEANAAEETTE